MPASRSRAADGGAKGYKRKREKAGDEHFKGLSGDLGEMVKGRWTKRLMDLA